MKAELEKRWDRRNQSVSLWSWLRGAQQNKINFHRGDFRRRNLFQLILSEISLYPFLHGATETHRYSDEWWLDCSCSSSNGHVLYIKLPATTGDCIRKMIALGKHILQHNVRWFSEELFAASRSLTPRIAHGWPSGSTLHKSEGHKWELKP